MAITLIVLILLLLLLLIPGSYWLDDYLYGVYSADTQERAAAYYADSIAPRTATRATYEGAFDGILPNGNRL
uniref:Uncharacterized protein n=1 Tax=viral metagenome TaxID=1070528 RepID=A0A6C0JUC0_9ZZZZ